MHVHIHTHMHAYSVYARAHVHARTHVHARSTDGWFFEFGVVAAGFVFCRDGSEDKQCALSLRFALPPGCYATMLVREMMLSPEVHL